MTSYVMRLYDRPKVSGTFNTDWARRHQNATKIPGQKELGVVNLIKGWLTYADQHKARYESGIGEDGVLGKEWAAIGMALLGLLNGELGSLDGGTLDGLIRNTMTSEGFDPDTM